MSEFYIQCVSALGALEVLEYVSLSLRSLVLNSDKHILGIYVRGMYLPYFTKIETILEIDGADGVSLYMRARPAQTNCSREMLR